MAPAPRGFAGLESLIPKVEVKALPAVASSVPAPTPSLSASAPASPAVPEKLDRDTGPLSVKIIGGLIVIGIIWAIIENNSERPELASPGTAPTPSADTVVSVGPPPATVPEPAVPSWAPVTETRPDTLYKPILDANEIAYCLAEELRMNTVQPLINKYSHAEIVGFNTHVDDYNQRCARYEYHQSDMDSAQAYLASHRDEIMSEARSWPARWRRSRSTSGLQTPPEHTKGPRPS